MTLGVAPTEMVGDALGAAAQLRHAGSISVAGGAAGSALPEAGSNADMGCALQFRLDLMHAPQDTVGMRCFCNKCLQAADACHPMACTAVSGARALCPKSSLGFGVVQLSAHASLVEPLLQQLQLTQAQLQPAPSPKQHQHFGPTTATTAAAAAAAAAAAGGAGPAAMCAAPRGANEAHQRRSPR